MKTLFTLICLLISTSIGYSQVGIGTKNPDTTSVLDLSSTTKGLLIPRMTTVQRNAIISPAMGLQILNVDDMCLDIYDGRQWIKNCGLKESDAMQGASRSSISDSIWTKDGDRIFPADPARIGIGTEMPDSSALLDIASTSQGFLMPRMTTAQRDLIAAPAVGLQILNLDDMCVDIYDGAGWIKNCGYQITGHDTISASWTPKATFLGISRTGAVGFSIGSIGYLGTGGAGFPQNDFWAYDPASNAWSQKANVSNIGRENAIALTIPTTNGTRGFIGTGRDEAGTYLNDFWEFNPDSNKWESRSPLPGVGFYAGAAFCIESMGYVGTGRTESGGAQGAFYKYDYNTNSWSTIEAFPKLRAYTTAFVQNGMAYVGLGEELEFFGQLGYIIKSNFYAYSPVTGHWDTQPISFPVARKGVSTFSINGFPYLLCGKDENGYYNTAYRFTGSPNYFFIPIPDFPGAGRWQAVAFAIGNKGYIGTGEFAEQSYALDFYEYDPYPTAPIYSIPPPPEPMISYSDGLWTKKSGAVYNNSENIGIGLTSSTNKLDINSGAERTGQSHPGGRPLYVTGNMSQSSFGIEFRETNGTQGIGFGYNTIYATGSNSDQNLGLMARGSIGALKFSTNHLERMRIQGNGNVGIDNAMPLAPLHFNDAAENRKIVLSSVINNDHQFYGMGTGDGQLRYQIADDTGSVAHVFLGASSNSTSKELMRIQGDGEIGIGTSTPNELLEIGGSGRAFFGDGGEGNNRTGLLIDGNESGEFTRLESYNYQTQTGMNLIINSTGHGNVGIGAVSAHAPLQFRNSYANRKIVLYENANNDYQVYGLGVNDNVLRYQVPDTFSSHILYAGTSATTSAELMRIQGNGKVGIGTNNPSQLLHVQGSAVISTKLGIGITTPVAPLQFANANATRKIVLSALNNDDHQFSGFGIETNTLRYNIPSILASHVFMTGTSASSSIELMRIQGDGNVGIGIANARNKLDINHGAPRTGAIVSGHPMYVTGDNILASSDGVEFRHSNGTQGIGFGYNTIYATGSLSSQDLGLMARGLSGVLKFTTNNLERMVIKGNGNIGIGTSTPNHKLELSTDDAFKPGTPVWIIPSDSRLKKDIEPFTDGLDLIRKINPVWFRYNGLNGITDTSRFAGIIAQEIQKIAPYMIGTTKSADRDGESYLSYDANSMTYILINAVKEQQTLIDSQQAMIESQQVKYDELQNVNGFLKSQFESSINDLQLKLMQMEAMIHELKAERNP